MIRTGVIFAISEKNIQEGGKKIIDKFPGRWYTNQAKQRRRRIRLTSSRLGKEVNNVVFKLPEGGLLLRGCRFGIRVL